MSYIFKNRKIIAADVEGINPKDAPDFSDAYISSAVWADTKAELTEEELEELNETADDLIYNLVQDHLQGSADRLYDQLRER